jgi:hypothetical protein
MFKLYNTAAVGRMAGITELTVQNWAKKMKGDLDWVIYEKKANKVNRKSIKQYFISLFIRFDHVLCKTLHHVTRVQINVTEFCVLFFKSKMFKGFPKEVSYTPWLLTAEHLSPIYDYFDFANTFVRSKEQTNRSYSNVMKKALQNAEGEAKLKIANTINKFNVLKSVI